MIKTMNKMSLFTQGTKVLVIKLDEQINHCFGQSKCFSLGMPKVQVTPRSLWSILSRSRGGVGKVLSPRRRRCLGWDLRKKITKQTAELSNPG